MSTETKPTGLHAKIAQAMGEIGRVPKRGRNQAQNYSYARADDVAEHTREILARLGIAVYASVEDKGTREITTKNGTAKVSCVVVAWTFVDGETGQERTVNVPGEGMDYGDKGIYKAMTGSLKYALMLGFLIPTGDGDPERDEEPAPQPRKVGVRPKDAKPAPLDPVVRKAEAVAWIEEKYPGKVRDRLAFILNRTFPVAEEIKLHNLAELEKVEQWIVLGKAAMAKDPAVVFGAE